LAIRQNFKYEKSWEAYAMKNANFLTLSICVIIILAMAFAVTGFFSYRAYSSSSGLEKVYLQAIRTLKELIGSQNTKIASLNKKIAVLEDRLTANSVFSNIGSKNEISRNNCIFRSIPNTDSD
jgi:hypothetical protein